MSGDGFTHLHLHTQYSLLDGAIAFGKLFDRCKELGMESVALTDHGNMFGAVEFYKEAKAAGIKPIIGMEAYIAPGSRFDKSQGKIKDSSYHLILLAENITGYKNLLKLASAAYTEGFYYRPRIDKEILKEYSEGLICTSACISGEIPRHLRGDHIEEAQKALDSYLDIFGKDSFFIEIQHHPTIEDSDHVRKMLIDLARKNDVQLIATNDVHFLNEDDYEAHDALTCISTGKIVSDTQRMVYPPSVFLKSQEQMREMFADTPDACDNTMKIAERCNVDIDLSSRHAPSFVPPDGSTPEEYLTKLVYEGAKNRYGQITDEIKKRIDRELEVIEGKGFSSYFLIVWELCNWATEHNIAVGARGSAVGTIVGYSLGICNIDPIKYDLLFERFMDPERNEMPDIDVDICQAGRPKFLEHVREKYGEIAQIITFGTMKARAVMRDVCRVMDVPLADADRLAKLIPNELKMTIEKALEIEPQLRKEYEQDERTHKVIEICKRLEGLTRHCSVHACAVVIADEPLTNFLPLYKAAGSDDLVTQFEGPMVEAVGLLKMDFLGLKTLSVIERAIELVEENHGIRIDIEKIDIDDPKVFEIFGSGHTKGVFQFESGGMADLLMKLKPDRLEDLIAANALYRPGPMTLIPDFIERKHGAKWTVPHPIMREILEETFGIMVYQEQVMKIGNQLGDIPLREAYGMIKAISKKKHKVIAKAKEQFVAGCLNKGLSDKQAGEIFDLIERFAGYGFNKSHASRYSLVAYQTAYLKAYYPMEFMTAVLTYEMGNTDKVVDYIGECKTIGIEVLGPEINQSNADFTAIPHRDPEDESTPGVIRFGLAAVKGVGGKAVEKIIEARQTIGRFKSLYHFCESVDLRAVNKQVIESLIKAGSFDHLGGSRPQMMAGLEKAMQIGSSMQSDAQSGQMNFFGTSGFGDNNDYENDHRTLPDVPPWTEMHLLSLEKDVLGFYVTSNPLSRHAVKLEAYSSVHTSDLDKRPSGTEVVIGGMITKIRNIITKNGKNAGSKMAVFVLEDLRGSCEVVMFPKILNKFSELVVADSIVFVRGKIETSRETPNIICDELLPHEEIEDKIAARIQIDLDKNDVTEERISRIQSICEKHKGKSHVCMTVALPSGHRVSTVADKKYCVKADEDFVVKLREAVRPGKVELLRK